MKDERIIRKFLTDKKHITVKDCDTLLLSIGYELRKGRGSHRTYHKKGNRPITIVIPKGTKYINSLYVNNIVKFLELEG